MNGDQIKQLRILRRHVPTDVMINITEEGLEFRTNRFRETIPYKALRVLFQQDSNNFYKNVGQVVKMFQDGTGS